MSPQRKESQVFIHIFGFQWKPEATEADKARAEKEILAFRGVIPGLIEVHVGDNLSPRGQGYTFAGLMKFIDKAAAIPTPSIQRTWHCLSGWSPLIDPVELDFEA